jgi:hypothetical protein
MDFLLAQWCGKCLHWIIYYKIYLKPIVDVKKAAIKGEKTPVFWHALFRTYRNKLIVGGLLRFVHDLFQLSGPLLLK